MKTFLLALLVSLFQLQESDSKESTKIKGSISQDLKVEKNLFSEATIYQKLYESEKENNEKLLSTIYWTLGTSVTFLLAIFGGQIFFNWKVNKKEIDYIKKDIEEQIGQVKAELLAEINKTNKENFSSINTRLDKIEKELAEKIDNQFNEKSKLLDVKEELYDAKNQSLKHSIEYNYKLLKIDIEKTKGDVWKIQDIESNALSSYLKSAILEIELGHEVKYILNDIVKTLNNLLEIHEADFERLEELISKLDQKYTSLKEKIISLYRYKPVYRFSDTKNISGFSIKEYIKNTP